MAQTAIQLAIAKIDEKIEIYQFAKLEASKVKDATSMERHHGAKIALVFIRQELVNLLEMEKQQMIDAFNFGVYDGGGIIKKYKMSGEQYYNEQFKSE